MTEAVTEATQTAEQAEVQAETDLSAGFNKVRAEKPPTEQKPEVKVESKVEEKPAEAKPAGNEQASTEVKTDATTKVEEKSKAPLIAGMTEEQLKAALGKGAAWEEAVRKVNGKFGEITRAIQEVKSAVAAGGSKSTRKITAQMLKRVSEELPGFGEALAQDLTEIFGEAEATTEKAQEKAVAQGKPFDAEAFFAEKIGPALETVKAQANEAAQTELLEYMHPNYAVTINSPEFGAWTKTLSAERQKEILESPRAVVAGRAISEFKDWNAKAQKAQEQKTKRLEGAITPKSGGQHAPGPTQTDEDEDLRTGFKQVKRVR